MQFAAGTQRPLVTFALFAYNQEQFIEDAVKGAFDQNYAPLEIILSDDCSTDRTFDLMVSLADAYRGPHKIILNRNARNLNIAGHINTINRLARGELVIVAAGDDVSLADRSSQIVNAWIRTNKQAGLLHSACRVIDESGAVLKDLACPCLDALSSIEKTATSNAFVIGATEAWSKSVFDFYGDLRSDVVHEDRALPFRSLLSQRSIVYIDEPLVNYRQGIGVSSAYSGVGKRPGPALRKTILSRLLTDANQKLDDLKRNPNDGLNSLVAQTASKYLASIRFEETMPPPRELLAMVKDVGIQHVARMIVKRIVNQWRDSR